MMIRSYIRGQEKLNILEKEKAANRNGSLTVRSERRMMNIWFAYIRYIESLGDYVKIITSRDETIITKEKISRLGERLPGNFLRIHRSFIVNRDKISSFSKEFVTIENTELPVSRKYKTQTFNQLRC